MSLWTFREVSEMLQCSPQNIYQKKSKLKNMGGIETDIDGKEKINDTGYNFLLRQRQATMETNSTNLNKPCLNSIENAENTSDSTPLNNNKQDFIFEFMQKQIDDLQKQLADEREEKKHWQELYLQQTENFNKIAYPLMLNTQEGNKEQEQKTRKGFLARLFS